MIVSGPFLADRQGKADCVQSNLEKRGPLGNISPLLSMRAEDEVIHDLVRCSNYESSEALHVLGKVWL
jgi:hypothetical protein